MHRVLAAWLPSFGGPGYSPKGPWGPIGAIIVIVLAIAAQLVSTLIVAMALAFADDGAPDPNQIFSQLTNVGTPIGIACLIFGQLTSLAIVWLAAGRGGARADTLRLAPPRPGWGEAALAGLGLALIMAVVELILYAVSGLRATDDARWLSDGLKSGPVGIALAISVALLAPIWEETTFRGLLLSGLANTRFGFWPAALISNTLWTILHGSYSWVGLVSVFVAGLVLSWYMQRTGSLRTCIVAHAVANVSALIFASAMNVWTT